MPGGEFSSTGKTGDPVYSGGSDGGGHGAEVREARQRGSGTSGLAVVPHKLTRTGKLPHECREGERGDKVTSAHQHDVPLLSITVILMRATKLKGDPTGFPESVTFTVTLNQGPGRRL